MTSHGCSQLWSLQGRKDVAMARAATARPCEIVSTKLTLVSQTLKTNQVLSIPLRRAERWSRRIRGSDPVGFEALLQDLERPKAGGSWDRGRSLSFPCPWIWQGCSANSKDILPGQAILPHCHEVSSYASSTLPIHCRGCLPETSPPPSSGYRVIFAQPFPKHHFPAKEEDHFRLKS